MDFLKRNKLWLTLALLISGLGSFCVFTFILPSAIVASTQIMLKNPPKNNDCYEFIAEQKHILQSSFFWKNVIQRLRSEYIFYEKIDENWQKISAEDFPFEINITGKMGHRLTAQWILEIEPNFRHFSWSFLKGNKSSLPKKYPLKNTNIQEKEFYIFLQTKKEYPSDKRIFKIEWTSFEKIMPIYLNNFSLEKIPKTSILQLAYQDEQQEESLKTLKLIIEEFSKFLYFGQIDGTNKEQIEQQSDKNNLQLEIVQYKIRDLKEKKNKTDFDNAILSDLLIFKNILQSRVLQQKENKIHPFVSIEPLKAKEKTMLFFPLWGLSFLILSFFLWIRDQNYPYFRNTTSFNSKQILPNIGEITFEPTEFLFDDTFMNPSKQIIEKHSKNIFTTFTKLYFLSEEEDIKTIIFQSLTANELALSTVFLAAQQWAMTQKKILLIDGHLENPQFQFFDELRANQSLRDYLIIEQMKETQIITNYQPNIDLVYSEKLAVIPNLKRLYTFLEWAQQQYDLVLIYAPCEELWNLSHSLQVLWVEEENTKIKEYRRFSKNIVKTREKRIFSGYLKVRKEV